jgi:hypothetical protein
MIFENQYMEGSLHNPGSVIVKKNAALFSTSALPISIPLLLQNTLRNARPTPTRHILRPRGAFETGEKAPQLDHSSLTSAPSVHPWASTIICPITLVMELWLRKVNEQVSLVQRRYATLVPSVRNDRPTGLASVPIAGRISST